MATGSFAAAETAEKALVHAQAAYLGQRDDFNIHKYTRWGESWSTQMKVKFRKRSQGIWSYYNENEIHKQYVQYFSTPTQTLSKRRETDRDNFQNMCQTYAEKCATVSH